MINKAISNFKRNYKEKATSFLIWGWVLSLASFTHFLGFKVIVGMEAYEKAGLYSIGNWTVFILAGFVITLFIERKKDKNKKVFSHLDTFLKYVWMVSVSTFIIVIFLSIKLEIYPPTFFLLIAGIATTITGLSIKFKPLIIGGIAFFLFCIASTYVSNENILLVGGAAVICGYLVPGYLLKSAKE